MISMGAKISNQKKIVGEGVFKVKLQVKVSSNYKPMQEDSRVRRLDLKASVTKKSDIMDKHCLDLINVVCLINKSILSMYL